MGHHDAAIHQWGDGTPRSVQQKLREVVALLVHTSQMLVGSEYGSDNPMVGSTVMEALPESDCLK